MATTFPRSSSAYFESLGIPIEIARVSGSTEIAPHLGVADVIVDLTSSGSTLRVHGLREIEFSASGAARGQENSGHARARHHFIRVRSHTETRQEAIPKPGQVQADARKVFSRACLLSGAGLCPSLEAVDSINPHAPNFSFEGS